MPGGARAAGDGLAERQRAAGGRRRGLLGLILLLAACNGGDADDTARIGDSGADTAADNAGDTSGDTDTGVASEDETLADLRADLDGTLMSVSREGGWPREVDGGYLFVYAASGSWKLAGDHDGWAGEDMTCEDDFCWIVRAIDAPGGYKFTDGTDWVADPWSRAYTYDSFGEMSLVRPEGARLERLFSVGGAGLAERTVRVWVPDGAATHVLYAHDGQNLFDPSAFFGGWRLQDSAPDGMMIVGVDNTADRMEEYTHVQDRIHGTWYGGQGDAYATFLQDTVRPLIADVYGEPTTVGTMGSSLGGLISFHVADRHPDEYAFAASLSGTMGWGSIGADNETMIERYAAAGHRGTALYLDSGGYGTTCEDADGDGLHDDDLDSADNYCENVQMRDVLEGVGYAYEVDLWHWHEPYAEHDEAAWADRVFRPLELFAAM